MTKQFNQKLIDACKNKKELEVQKDIIWCKTCGEPVKIRESRLASSIRDHYLSKRHNKNKSIFEPRQISMHTSFDECSKIALAHNDFFMDLTKMLTECNIPLYKVSNQSFKSFIKKYTNNVCPDESTLRKKYLDIVYQQKLNLIRNTIGNDDVYFVIDETTDVCDRQVLHILVGKLDGRTNKPMLLKSTNLDKTNGTTVAQAFINSMDILWPNEKYYNRVLLVVTDAATYMISAFNNLKSYLFPNMHHITCLAHALHRVCERIREEFIDVNQFISLMKKTLLKSNERKAAYRRITGLPLPPTPVITRWGTFLETAIFYLDNFKQIVKFINEVEIDAAAVRELKECIKKKNIFKDLQVFSDFRFLIDKFSKLHMENSKISEILKILEDLKSGLHGFAREKLLCCLEKNPDLDRFISIEKDYEFQGKILYAPLVSVSVERSFSQYKAILSSSRQGFSFENLEKMNVIYFNAFLE